MTRTWGVMAWVLLAAASAVEGSAHGQRVFEPAPGPDAVYLAIEERFVLGEDGTVVRERHERLAVNSYLAINRLHGEDFVVWDPAEERVEVLFNRTVLPSGEVVEAPANAIVEDLPGEVHRNPLWSRLRRTVVVHTALEPGAVIEWGFRHTRTGAPWLEAEVPLRLADPVRSLEVVVEVPAAVRVAWQLAPSGGAPEERTEGGRRTLRFHWQDLPALPEEPGSPPREEMTPTLWLSTASAGAAQEELSRRLAAAGPLPAGAAAAAATAVDGKASFEGRVLAVFEAVRQACRLSAADQSILGVRLAPLAAVWESGWATPLELAALARAALEAVGINATVALVGASGRDGAIVPGFVGFSRPVVLLADREGCVRLVDPSKPADGGPLEEALRDRSLLTALPRPKASACAVGPLPWQRTVTAALTVSQEGQASGEVEVAVAGRVVPHAQLVRDPAAVAQGLAALLPGGSVTDARVVALGRRSAVLAATVAGTLADPDATGLVRLPLGELSLPGSDPLPPPPGPGRTSPLLVGGPGEEVHEVTLRLPPGWRVAALPAKVQVENLAGAVVVSSEVRRDGVVEVRRRLALAARTVAAADAGAARALLAAWGTATAGEVLLRPPAGWKAGAVEAGSRVAGGGR